jgi:cyclophilin family peptidyl-prolyl cis-trans isomerase
VVVLIAGFIVLRPGGGGSGASPRPSGASTNCPTSQPPPLGAGETRTVTIDTPKGAIAIKVEANLSPIAAGNFVALAACGFYDGSIFHRVVPGFVIQGGATPGSGGQGGPGYTITDEPVTALYGRGTVAMARTSQPNSVDSQFFIVLDDAARGSLSSANTYQIIGTVSAGMTVADAITAAADREIPTAPVVMTTVTVANP